MIILGLTGDQRLQSAADAATQKYGTGSTGSRLLTGHRELHRQLEEAIASLKQTEDALVFSTEKISSKKEGRRQYSQAQVPHPQQVQALFERLVALANNLCNLGTMRVDNYEFRPAEMLARDIARDFDNWAAVLFRSAAASGPDEVLLPSQLLGI